MESNVRPDPDKLLAQIKEKEAKEKKGKLKIYFGMCAGVGKTYAMLQDAQREMHDGVDVVLGYIETHGRLETEALLKGLSIIPRKVILYNDVKLEEMDLDAILHRKPKIVIVDELAHTNVPGSRHSKRYLDVLEILDNGIDVFTTVNVQHLESSADTVNQISGIPVRETVPDSILDTADEIELIDISPEELLVRLKEGKVYKADRTEEAIRNFFRKGNLTALREMSLRITADRVDKQLRQYMKERKITGPWKSGQRIMAAISHSPYSYQLIRWVRRVAYSMGSSWIAVYVETSRTLSLEDKTTLKKNFDLARELGAEIITTADEDIVTGIIRIAKDENVSQIFVGKPHNYSFLSNLFKNKIVERLIHLSGNFDIYVVGGEKEKVKQRSLSSFLQRKSSLSKYMSTSILIFAVALICFPFSDVIGYHAISYIFLLTVALLPLTFGPGPVLLAAAISSLLWDFMFIPPIYTFSISSAEDYLMFAMYFIFAIVTSILTTRVRSREKSVRHREERAVALYNLANELSSSNNIDSVIQTAVNNIIKVFNADTAILLADSRNILFNTYANESRLTLDKKEFSVASWVFNNGKKAGKFTDTLPIADALYLPLISPRKIIGVCGVKFKDEQRLDIDQESLLESFIRQIAVAIERELLNETARRSLLIEESEKLYKNLFSSISHELKTPVSAIMGSSSYLIDKLKEKDKSDVDKQLLQEILIASSRLNRLIENLLDMTRIESGRMELNLDFTDVRDLINSAINQLQTELKGYNVDVNIPDDMPLVQVDFVLMEQVLKNILHNTSLYTPEGTEVKITVNYHDNNYSINIKDNGTGISKEHLDHIFDKFYRVQGNKTGGSGLGLSISKGFIEAHRGSIKVESDKDIGTSFIITLPIKLFKIKDEQQSTNE
jgi:two-component system, OmpR family, sensor histidine kinase KdpD